MNESVLRYASKTVLQCSDFTFFSYERTLLTLYSNIRISLLSMFGVNDQNQNRQQSCSKRSKCLQSPNILSVRIKPSEVVSAVQSDFMNQEKEEVVKQLSKTEESIKKRCKYRVWIVTEKLEIGEYAILHAVASTLKYSSLRYLGISKQSISDFKKVCKQMSVKSIFICFYSYEKK